MQEADYGGAACEDSLRFRLNYRGFITLYTIVLLKQHAELI